MRTGLVVLAQMICQGRRERVGQAPELSVGGENSVRTGLVVLAPE